MKHIPSSVVETSKIVRQTFSIDLQVSTSGENRGLPLPKTAEVVSQTSENPPSAVKTEQSDHSDPPATTGGTPDESESVHYPSPFPESEPEKSSSYQGMRSLRKRAPIMKRGPRTKEGKLEENAEKSSNLKLVEGVSLK